MDTRDQFARVEGLGQIVIRSSGEALHLGARIGEVREHNGWSPYTTGTQFAQQVVPTGVRYVEIQEYPCRQCKGVSSGRGDISVQGGLPERLFKTVRHHTVIRYQ